MTPVLTIRSSTDIIAAVPFLLGFHPTDSLVVVGINGTRVIFTARYDLPPADLADDQARHLAELVAGQGITRATLIGYGTADQVTPALRPAAEAIRRRGMTVVDAMRVTDGQFWSSFCADPECCPKPCPPADSAVAAAATFAGQVALPDRAALAAQLAPVTGTERAAMEAATGRAQGRLADEFGADLSGGDFARMLRRAGRRAVRDAERRHRSGRRLTDDEVAWLGVMLVDVKVRDYAWERTGEEEWRIQLWSDVLRRVEPGYVPAPASLLSFAAWRQGSGALAREGADRALAHDPAYVMAIQMDELLCRGVSPEMVRDWPMVERSAFDPSAPSSPSPAGGGRRGWGAGASSSPGPMTPGVAGRSGGDRRPQLRPAAPGGRGSRHGAHRKHHRRSL